MELVRRSLNKWIEASVIIVIAILLIVAGATYSDAGGSAPDAVNAISVVIGIAFLLSGAISFLVGIVAAIKIKKNLGAMCAPGAFLIAIGSSLVVAQYAGYIIDVILYIIPYLLIAFGILIIADSIFNLVKSLASERKKSALFTIPSFIYGAGALVLGILSIGVEDAIISERYQVIILGILLIIFAFIVVLLTFIKLPKPIVVVEEEITEEN